MRLTILAVGRLKSGPELSLVDDYRIRVDRTGRALGLGPLDIREIDTRRAPTKAAEAEALAGALPDAASVVVLDERGKTMTSPKLAGRLAGWRDAGRPEAVFVIGGADGLTDELRGRADLLLSFGPMVWPHMLARVMLAEQLYRATSILAGGPYHRA